MGTTNEDLKTKIRDLSDDVQLLIKENRELEEKMYSMHAQTYKMLKDLQEHLGINEKTAQIEDSWPPPTEEDIPPEE